MVYDVIIIGAGVSGCAVARELSKYELKVLVMEKEEDVCCGTSKANSAIIHAGYDCQPGSMMARMNVRGNAMMDDLARDLDIPFKRNGSFVVCVDEKERGGIEELYERGVKNGVENLRILEKEEALAMEPNLSDDTVCVLYAPSAGIVCPFRMTEALAENAYENGVEFVFNTEVKNIYCDDSIWKIETNDGEYLSKYVVNAAGVHADEIHNMVSENKIHITPRRGDYFLLDKSAGSFVSHTIFPQPTKKGKGTLCAPTIHGNLIVGPTAIDIEDKESTATTAEGLDVIREKSSIAVKNLPLRETITSFAGLRAHEDGHEFILGEVKDGFIDCAGIESPGLSSAPAIGEYLGNLIHDLTGCEEKKEWKSTGKDIVHLDDLSMEEANALIQENPAYGQIICRCENVTEGEILDAIHRPLGAKSLDGVKRRTRAGMGRCQAGFCSPRVMEILERELGMDLNQVTKSGGDSYIVYEKTKEAE